MKYLTFPSRKPRSIPHVTFLLIDSDSACAKDEQFGLYFNRTMMDGHKWSNEALISVLVTFFLTISSIFMVLIIFFTISFTIRSVIKNAVQVIRGLFYMEEKYEQDCKRNKESQKRR